MFCIFSCISAYSGIGSGGPYFSLFRDSTSRTFQRLVLMPICDVYKCFLVNVWKYSRSTNWWCCLYNVEVLSQRYISGGYYMACQLSEVDWWISWCQVPDPVFILCLLGNPCWASTFVFQLLCWYVSWSNILVSYPPVFCWSLAFQVDSGPSV